MPRDYRGIFLLSFYRLQVLRIKIRKKLEILKNLCYNYNIEKYSNCTAK
jgi:hypothetical protein